MNGDSEQEAVFLHGASSRESLAVGMAMVEGSSQATDTSLKPEASSSKEILLDEAGDEAANQAPSTSTRLRPRSDLSSAGQALLQRWRLSMDGFPTVVGMVCEKRSSSDVLSGLQSGHDHPGAPNEKDSARTRDTDREDNVFKVPLLQSLVLASAKFDTGRRIPLVLYFVMDELRTRGNLNSATDLAFADDWENDYEGIEALIKTFDQRPFGHGHNLSLRTEVDGHDECPRSPSCRQLSAVVLCFLADLPEPLIPQDVFTALSALVRLQGEGIIKQQAVSLLLQVLTEAQNDLLQFLLEFVDEMILKPLRDEIGHELVSGKDTCLTEEENQSMESRKEKYRETRERVLRVLGSQCIQVVPRRTRLNQDEKDILHRRPSLYGHFKKVAHQKALQERHALSIEDATLVFSTLLEHHLAGLDPATSSGSVSSLPSHGQPEATTAINFDSQLESPIDERSGDIQELEYGYQSDSALFDPSTRNQLSKRTCKAGSRLSLRRHKTQTTDLPAIVTTAAEDGQEVQKKTSSETLCDSAVEVSSNVDLLAITAMQEHMARSQRSLKHLPRPSVATIHSIMAETQSVVGEGQSLDNNKDSWRLSSMNLSDGQAREYNLEGGPDKWKQKREIGFLDFLQEPLDRKQEQREIQIVERDILQSEVTTKYLASNLASLYPSSSHTTIPPVILPSARNMLLHHAAVTGAVLEGHDPIRYRELQITPQTAIQLPSDHCQGQCSCSYCTTVAKPSAIPLMTKAEHDLAELQSQCDAKDQHVGELLRTVQDLQGQVNILNAKLLFLHDHHTTRPMRRRTLARNSTHVHQSSGGLEWFARKNQPHNRQSMPGTLVYSTNGADPEIDNVEEDRMVRAPMASRNGTWTPSSVSSAESPKRFPEGIRADSNSDGHLWDSTQRQKPDHRHELVELEDDEAMSILELEAPLAAHQRIQGRYPSTKTPVVNDRGTSRDRVYETEIESALRDMEEVEDEPEREGEDLLDEYYYIDAYKTMDQQLYRRPLLPVPAPPKPMSSDQYKKHHRMSLPIQSLISKRLSLGNAFRWKGRATAAAAAGTVGATR